MKRLDRRYLYGIIAALIISFYMTIFAPVRILAASEDAVLLHSTGMIGGSTSAATSGMVALPDGSEYLKVIYDAGSRTNNVKAKCSCDYGGAKCTASGKAIFEVYNAEEKLLGQTVCSASSQIVELSDYYEPAYIVARTDPQSSSNTCSGCGHTGRACGEPSITINVYGVKASTTPILNVDLSDVTMIEDKDDCAFNVSASFPGGVEAYEWEYTEGGNWVSLVDGAGHYTTGLHGGIDFADKAGGTEFSSSNLLKITSPKIEMTGLKFRVRLKSGSESEDALSSEAQLTVVSKDISGFTTVKYVGKNAQIGSQIDIEDVVAYVRFNSDQVADAYELKEKDSRVTFYGFDDADTTVKAGTNTFRLKMTYVGSEAKSVFKNLTVTGVDNAAPVFEENIALYENDKTTLYKRGKDCVDPADEAERLFICGKITDSVCEDENISWAYTIADAENDKDNVTIPVYRSGSKIEVEAKCNGTYTLYAKDEEKNTSTKVITVNAYDESPKIKVTPENSSKGRYADYNIDFSDNNALKMMVITGPLKETVASITHDHDNCTSACTDTYLLKPQTAGTYTITATDYAGNKSEATVEVVKKSLVSLLISGLSETMTVNSKIVLGDIIKGNRVLLGFTDGTKEIYSEDYAKALGLSLKMYKDSEESAIDEAVIDYGNNALRFSLTENDGENVNTYIYEWNITGEDNVAPLPGRFEVSYSDGWDGSLTNDINKTVTLYASGCEDDGSDKDNLTVTWYKDDEEIKKGTILEGADAIGPFSGEENNGVYTYIVTDEKGNYAMASSSRTIMCWDTTPPKGEVVILPEGTSEDSKARFKQIQIINAEDNMGLNEKPYSFKGDNDESYGIVGSIVAGENADYEIYLRDAVGNSTCLRKLTLSGIDSKAPTINGYTMEENEEGKLILHIDAADGENGSDALSYSIDGENYQESPDFEISDSGVYTIYVKDETGNVTKTSTEYADTVNPIISAAQDEAGAGVIIINISDDIGLSRLMMTGPDGIKEVLQVYDGITEDIVNKEIGRIGTYDFTVTDMAGNSESTSVNVTGIAAACSSSILTGLKITPDGWTSGDVTVIAQLKDTTGLSSSPFSWNGGVPTAMPYVIMNNNGQAHVDVCDKYGNIIASDDITVSNIDRLSPVMSDLVQSEDLNHIVFEASDEGSGIAQVTISGGPYTTESPVLNFDNAAETGEIMITLPTNGSYTVRAYDAAGNSCQKQITAEGVTTDASKPAEEKIVYKEKIVYEEGETNTITVDRVVENKVEVPVPVLVPVPTVEYVTKYKTSRENGEDTTRLIREKSDSIGTLTTESDNADGDAESGKEEVETLTSELEKAGAENRELGTIGTMTKDGTYIGPDGYEYFGRVDPNLKKDHPVKYWFKKNAEAIAITACIMAAILLALCIVMGIMLTRDYAQETHNKAAIKRLKKQ